MHENMQKSVGDMMSGALIQTSARKIKTIAEIEKQKRIVTRMLQDRELSIDNLAMYTELKVKEVEKLAGLQTV